MGIRYISRILPSTGKIHQNQEVVSGGGQAVTLKASHDKSPLKVLIKNEKQNKNSCSDSRRL